MCSTGVSLLALAAIAAQPADDPTVVELFTSQACSLCPAADKLLAELAAREDVIALSYPITYWDTDQWMDTLARPQHVERQKAYTDILSNKRVYTPQMVVDGAADVNGSHPDEVLDAIAAAPADTVELDLDCGAGSVRARLSGEVGGRATVLRVSFESAPTVVNVGGGANGGRKLTYTNVVRDAARLGTYAGGETALSGALPSGPSLDHAVIVQIGEPVGRVAAAARCPA
ncbi:MAG: DUF1223 domain-containing protein [Pseudomonadota bacterium]